MTSLDEFLERNRWPRYADGEPVMIGDELYDEGRRSAYVAREMLFAAGGWAARDGDDASHTPDTSLHVLKAPRRFADLTDEECATEFRGIVASCGDDGWPVSPPSARTALRLLDRMGLRDDETEGER